MSDKVQLADLSKARFDGCLGECGVWIEQAFVGDRKATREELDHIEATEMDAIRLMAKAQWEEGE